MIIINADKLILGRMATYAAKQALLGEEVRIINAEKAIISGKRATILKEKAQTFNRGIPTKGPFVTRMPDRYVRRVIRGMLPHRQAKGAEAYKRILCYTGVPEEFKDAKAQEMPEAKMEKLPTLKYTTVQDALRNA